MSKQLFKSLKSALAAPLRLLLAVPWLRRRLLFEITQHYYHELGIVLPLEGGLKCPLISREHWVSYVNLFCEREYGDLLSLIPLPGRWLDIGCHAGHFSLMLVAEMRKRGLTDAWSALLLDPDSRVPAAVRAMIRENRFDPDRMLFQQGAIAETGDEVRFGESGYMTSETFVPGHSYTAVRTVRRISENDILSRLAPPYDLVKLDIEGAEFDFLRAYPGVLCQTKFLLFEWHSWHHGGGGKTQLLALAGEQGFQFVAGGRERSFTLDGQPASTGVVLMKNTRFMPEPEKK